MIEFLNQIDKIVFLFMNHTLANPVTDLIMPIITSQRFLQITYGLGMLLVLWKGNARLRWMVLFSAIVLLLTDQITATYLKNWIERIRPCHTIDLEQINLLVNCGAGKSLPSAHASNAFGQAVFWSFDDKKPRVYLYIFASMIGLSRIFVGVHYPGDVIAGAILGIVIGVGVAFGFGKLKKFLIKEKVND
jgi:undecaprenyl-diphosphatase